MGDFLRIGSSVALSVGRLAGITLGDGGNISILTDFFLRHSQGQEPLKKTFSSSPGKVFLSGGFADTRSLADQKQSSFFCLSRARHGTIPAPWKTLGTTADSLVEPA